LGLRFDLLSKQAKHTRGAQCGQKIELMDIGRYFTLLEKYVNSFNGTDSNQMITHLGNSISFLSPYDI